MVSRPAPLPDADSAFFWSGLREHKLLLQQCAACGRHRFPAMPTCPYCAARGSRVVQSAGTGCIYSWIVVHRAFDPAFAADVPYVVLTVTLDEGPKIIGVLQPGDRPGFGARVAASYEDRGEWTELRFSALT